MRYFDTNRNGLLTGLRIVLHFDTTLLKKNSRYGAKIYVFSILDFVHTR